MHTFARSTTRDFPAGTVSLPTDLPALSAPLRPPQNAPADRQIRIGDILCPLMRDLPLRVLVQHEYVDYRFGDAGGSSAFVLSISHLDRVEGTYRVYSMSTAVPLSWEQEVPLLMAIASRSRGAIGRHSCPREGIGAGSLIQARAEPIRSIDLPAGPRGSAAEQPQEHADDTGEAAKYQRQYEQEQNRIAAIRECNQQKMAAFRAAGGGQEGQAAWDSLPPCGDR